MKKLILVMPILAVTSLGIIACNGNDGRMATTTSQVQMNDLELASRIKSSLDADNELKAANLKVDVDRIKKVATLYGTVESTSLRTKAINLAESAQSEVTIHDEIDIAPTEVSRRQTPEENIQFV